MKKFLDFIFGFILLIIWIIAGGFITQANTYIAPFKDKDEDMMRAYNYTLYAEIITWGLLALFALLVILAIIGVAGLFGSGAGEAAAAEEGAAAEATAAEEDSYDSTKEKARKAKRGFSWFGRIILIISFALVVVNGLLAVLAANSLIQSSNFDNMDKKLTTAYSDCIIAGSMSLGFAGLLVIGLITHAVVVDKRKKEAQQQQQTS